MTFECNDPEGEWIKDQERVEVTLGIIRNQFWLIREALKVGEYRENIDELASKGITMVDYFAQEVSQKIDHAKELIDSLPQEIEKALGRQGYELTPKTTDDTPVDDDDWEDVKTGLGTEWDFDKNGTLTGYYVGPREVELPEGNATGRPTAMIHEFATIEGGEQVFIWESYQLAQALTEPGHGDLVRISFLGEESFKGKDGPRRVKKYKVQMKKR